MSDIGKIISQNIMHPDYWFYNLNPATAERDNENDLTAPLVSWGMILFIIIIVIIMIGRLKHG